MPKIIDRPLPQSLLKHSSFNSTALSTPTYGKVLAGMQVRQEQHRRYS